MSGRIGGRPAPAPGGAEGSSADAGDSGDEAEAPSTSSELAAALAPAEQAADGMADEPVPAGAPEANGDDLKDELPPVEELVQRLRPEVLTTLDELFRAKWIGVKRVRPEDLKPN